MSPFTLEEPAAVDFTFTLEAESFSMRYELKRWKFNIFKEIFNCK